MTDRSETDIGSLADRLAAGSQFYRRSGARLTEGQADVVERIGDTPSAYQAGYHAFDLSHVLMLVEQGLLPPSVGRKLLTGLRELEDADGDASAARSEIGRGAHAAEAYLIDEYGENVGGWIHLGRSTHDMEAVAERFVIRDRLLTIGERLTELVDTYAQRAEETMEAPIPTYTGLQHAQVGTIGFHLCSLVLPHERDLERLVALYDRINRSPAGAAVGTTTDFEIDRERVAALLGFDKVCRNTEDVDKSVDHLLETGGVLATIAGNLGSAADRFLLWYALEFGVLDIPDRLCGTSSIMPQKKNPHSIETVQRETSDILGEALQQYVAVKNAAGGVRIAPAVLDQTIKAIETWTAVVDAVVFDRERAAALVTADWALATDLAALLVREGGLSWRSAHQIVAVIVRWFEEDDRTIADLSVDDLAAATQEYCGTAIDLSKSQLKETLNPQRALGRREDVIGSPAPSRVRDQVESLHESATAYQEALVTRRETLERAHQQREEAVEAILDS